MQANGKCGRADTSYESKMKSPGNFHDKITIAFIQPVIKLQDVSQALRCPMIVLVRLPRYYYCNRTRTGQN